MHSFSAAKLIIAAAAALQGITVLAADCTDYGQCGILSISTREQLYAARQHVCGDTKLYQGDGAFCAEGGGQLTWPGGNSQQVCWDAFQNILDQCQPQTQGMNYHGGIYTWNGRRYTVDACAAQCY